MGAVAEAKKILPIASARRGQTHTPSPVTEIVTGHISLKKGRKKLTATGAGAGAGAVIGTGAGGSNSSLLATAMETQRRQDAAATQAAAQLMTQMSQVNTKNEDQSMLSTPAPGVQQQVQGVGGNIGEVYSAQSHQASYSQTQTPAGSTGVYSLGTTFATPMSAAAGIVHNESQMKIIAPQPELTIKKNMFPEPSPAACGKRKAIEIAAAQMLAGVAASGGMSHSGDMAMRATPPPPPSDYNAVELNNDFIAVALVGSLALVGSRGVEGVAGPGPAGSLQIINPENLQSKRPSKRRSLGQDPVTPWDGQLEALNR